jgi:preprotein translocase subunit SecD
MEAGGGRKLVPTIKGGFMRYSELASRLLLSGLHLCAIVLGSPLSTAQARHSPRFEIRDLVDSTSTVKHEVKDQEGNRFFVGDTVFFNSADLKSVTADKNPEGAGSALNFTFGAKSADRWSQYTASRVGKRIAIIANDIILATPKFLDPIVKPKIMLSLPDKNLQQAKKMASELSPKER